MPGYLSGYLSGSETEPTRLVQAGWLVLMNSVRFEIECAAETGSLPAGQTSKWFQGFKIKRNWLAWNDRLSNPDPRIVDKLSARLWKRFRHETVTESGFVSKQTVPGTTGNRKPAN